jgi:ketosteroid isomerase-like protein
MSSGLFIPRIIEDLLYNFSMGEISNRTAVLERLHEAQRRFYAGGSGEGLRDLLTEDIEWTVPGRNAIAGHYEGIEEVMSYFGRRRDFAAGTFRMHPSEVLVGEGDHVAALTDGSAVIAGVEERWSTVGLYRFRGDRVAACWLLPLDPEKFDRIWESRPVS